MNHYSLPIDVVTALKRLGSIKTLSYDQGKPVILVLLHLSGAFNTVNHNVPFSRLKDKFGLSGKVLELFRSNLKQRRECRFMVFYLTFSFCYSVYHRVQFMVLWFTKCIPVLLWSLPNDIGLNITVIWLIWLWHHSPSAYSV